ncbi:MAG: cell wall-binding repeat-containing protein [Acidimicrobiaceae bacterium]|nr:cell wall-binding repeat-containing protein [Acidimicrobiaceae bacterium]
MSPRWCVQRFVRRRLAIASLSVVLAGSALLAPAPAAAQASSAAVQRVSGSSVYELAANVAGGSCSSDTGSHSVALASGENWPDALAGTALDRPLLLTAQAFLPAATRSYLEPCASHNRAKVIILGGTAAVSEGVAEALRDMGFRVDRLAGADRYATARRVARVFAPDVLDTVYLASDVSFADAVAAAPSVTSETPLILTTPDELGDEARRFLTDEERATSSVTILGGTAAVSAAVEAEINELGIGTERIAGADRYETAALVARRALADPRCHPVTDVAVASGTTPFGGLAAGAVRGPCEPLLLAPGPDTAVPETLSSFGRDWLLAVGSSVRATLTGIGPASAVSAAALAAVATGAAAGADADQSSEGLNLTGWNAAARSVVQIRCRAAGGDSIMQGSGFVVGDGRQVVTSHHVIFDDAGRRCSRIRAYLDGAFELVPERFVSLTVQRSDEASDLALLAMDPRAQRRPAMLLATEPPLAGETLTALGYPEVGGDTMTLTAGLYSGTLQLRGATWLKTDTPLFLGSSGGPVLNNRREVVGVATLLHVSVDDDTGLSVGSIGVLVPIAEVAALLAGDIGR